MGAPKDRVQTFRFHPHICYVCLETARSGSTVWGSLGETSSPLPLPLLPTLSLDSRREPRGGETASSALPGVQMQSQPKDCWMGFE